MIHPWDPRYIEHNKQLAKVKAEWKEVYLIQPDIQDLRASAWREQFLLDFPEIGGWPDSFEAILEKFREIAGYDPMIPWPEGEDRFVEEWGFIPELVF
jgi:hypothetical protein